jgi:hypothetical protein
LSVQARRTGAFSEMAGLGRYAAIFLISAHYFSRTASAVPLSVRRLGFYFFQHRLGCYVLLDFSEIEGPSLQLQLPESWPSADLSGDNEGRVRRDQLKGPSIAP